MSVPSKNVVLSSSAQNIDLNLLYLFAIVYEERNVTRAAERLFLTPSAVSHALGRLRRMIGDELFIRGSDGMQPTPRATEVAGRLQGILPQLRDVLAPAAFDSSRSDRAFTIACVPYLTTVLIPRIAAAFHQAAPLARLDVRFLYGNVAADLDSGALDLALGNFRRTPPRFVTQELLQDNTVWVIRRDNQQAKKPLTLRALSELPHADIMIGGDTSGAADSYGIRQGLERLVIQNNLKVADAAFAQAGMRRDVRWVAPDTLSAMHIVAMSNGTALVPASAARLSAGSLGLVAREPPYVSRPLAIQQLYHAVYGARPATRWLIDLIQLNGKCDREQACRPQAY